MPVRLCCCICDRPITKLHRTKLADTRKLFPDLCGLCAQKLDGAFELAREQWLKEIDISSRNAAINSARRELLGTKG